MAIQVPGDVGYLFVGWLAIGTLLYVKVEVNGRTDRPGVLARVRSTLPGGGGSVE